MKAPLPDRRKLEADAARLSRRAQGLFEKFTIQEFVGAAFVLDLDHDPFAPTGLAPNGWTVDRNDGRSAKGEKHFGCRYYVIDLDEDPRARELLRAYSIACAEEYPSLSLDIRDYLAGKRDWL